MGKNARQELKDARKNLDRTVKREVAKNGGKPIDDSNRAYQAANKAVVDAEKRLPWWQR